VAGADDRQLVGMLADVWEEVGDEETAFASWFEFSWIGREEAHFPAARVDVLLVRRQWLARIFFQRGLVVERVHLARPAVHDQKDAGLGFGREVRRLWGQWIFLSACGFTPECMAGKESAVAEQARKCETRKACPHLPDELAADEAAGKSDMVNRHRSAHWY
jgi:hypothetical protein